MEDKKAQTLAKAWRKINNAKKELTKKFDEELSKLNDDQRVIENDFRSNPDETPERRLKLQLAYQLSRISRNKGSLVHDDLCDSLAGAVAYWTDYMAQTEDLNMSRRKDELLAVHLDNWGSLLNNTISQSAMGMTPQQIRNSNVSTEGFISDAY